MIHVEDVYKRYQTEHGPGPWVLQGVSLTIPPRVNVGLVGANGAGKSTLLRLIGGVDQPSRGRVKRECRVSWPLGFGGGLQGSLTGRQNAKFVCRIHGDDDVAQRLESIQAFAELGAAFDEPVRTYSSGMQARLKFAISLAFEFDVYISDELTAVGDRRFRQKARVAFRELLGHAGLIMVSHQEDVLREFCSAGIWLHRGRARWFDDIQDALAAYRDSQTADGKECNAAQHPDTGRVLARIKKQRRLLDLLQRGLTGEPVRVSRPMVERLLAQAGEVGMELVTSEQAAARGCQLKQNAIPVLRHYRGGESRSVIELYDLRSQCVRAEPE